MNSNLTNREQGRLTDKVKPVADLVVNPRRGYSASEPSNAEYSLVALNDEFNPTISE
jgi:hypothetical protein